MNRNIHQTRSAAAGFLGLEQLHQPVASRALFVRRFSRSLFVALLVVLVSLLIGACGYHYLEADIPWLDAFLNAAMILTGMGPVSTLQTAAGKLFAICYSLYSGIVFLTVVSLIMIPLLHRIFHSLHLNIDDANADVADSERDSSV